MGWLEKYPKNDKKNFSMGSLLFRIGLFLLLIGLIYIAFHYAIQYISNKVSPMVVQSTGVAGSGVAATFLISKILPFYIAFRAFFKIIRTIFTILFFVCLFLLYLNIKNPELFHSLTKYFS